MKVNEEKREKFIECAGKRVNNVLHDMQILEPMARSSVYDFTKEDIEEMFTAMQETLDNVKSEFYKKFEEKAKSEKKVFSFGNKVSTSLDVAKEVTIEAASNDIPAEPETAEVIENNITENIETIAAAEDLASVGTSDNNLVF